ncbi:type VII secretion protein EccE [Streptomyces avicenniae]|uniref:type VII secretion protein EccE n=1 Tax=Streptomyces avicenniae TaxID=500153 RepID=UPI000699BF86|nr:type VII secretion protein EccE [Streptomyces avicenniae]
MARRGGRRDGDPAPAPATTPPRPRRPLRFTRGRLVALEAGAGSIAAGVAFQSAWGYALAGAGGLLAAGALVRRHGDWADQQFMDQQRRRALAAASAPERPGGEDHLGLAHTLLPALDVTEVPDRNAAAGATRPTPRRAQGKGMGVLADGRGHAAVVAFPGGTLPLLPAAEIARWLDHDPARPAAAQLVVEQFGLPPWDFHYRYQPTVAYRQLPTGGRPIAVRSWLVLRYEPFDAPGAAERRGGGAPGARAALAAATARLRARLATLGAPSTPLDAEAVRALLRQIGDASGEGRAIPGSWAGNAATHCTVTAEIHRQADWTRLLTGLAACTADRVVTAATLTREGGELRVRTAVRVVSTVAQHAAAERDRLIQSGLVGPPATDQAAGLLATLPVAYPSRSLVEATGLFVGGRDLTGAVQPPARTGGVNPR